MKTNRTLSLFLLCHILVWSLLPVMLRPNLPMDSVEALVWGMIGEWGTNKHPPLSGWLADWAWLFGAKSPYALYILSQVLVCGGLIYIYKLAKYFLSADKALIATVMMEGVAYYNLVTPEYNCNIVALCLWPACSYHFYGGIKNNRLQDWVLFGLFAGLTILNKYVSGALLLSLGLYIISTPQGRDRLSSWKLYCGAFIGLGLVLPHIIWLYNRDFFVIDYFLGRTSGNNLPYYLGHIIYPLKFIASQIMTASLALLVFIIAYRHADSQKITLSKSDGKFIFYAGILPLLIMIIIPLLTGVKLKSMWGSPSLYMLTIILFVWKPFNISKVRKFLLAASYGLMLLFALVFALQCLTTLSPKFNLKAQDFTNHLSSSDVKYVGGSIWLASTIGVYNQSNPQVFFEMNPSFNPWIRKDDIIKYGALVVAENINTYNQYRQEFSELETAKVYMIKSRNIFGKQKEYPVYYGYLAGDNK